MSTSLPDSATLICYYSGEENTIAELKKKLEAFYEQPEIKDNGEEYCFFTDGTRYRLAVNTWHGEGKWSAVVCRR